MAIQVQVSQMLAVQSLAMMELTPQMSAMLETQMPAMLLVMLLATLATQAMALVLKTQLPAMPMPMMMVMEEAPL